MQSAAQPHSQAPGPIGFTHAPISVRPYSRSEDAKIVEGFWRSRGNTQFQAERDQPKCSVIAHAGNTILAVGGLIRTDSDFAFAEGFSTNPAADKAQRKAGLTLLAKAVTHIAKVEGYTRLMFISVRPEIAELGAALYNADGASYEGYRLFSIDRI